MLRRFLAVALLVSAAAVTVAGAERAILIMNNGERVSGMLTLESARPGLFSRLRQDAATLQFTNGDTRSFPLREIAVIDFVGDRPTQAELQNLSADTPHVMSLRNGGIRRGRLIGFDGGDVVRWETRAGVEQSLPIRNVKRIYLDPDNALNQLGYGPPVWSSGQNPSWNMPPRGWMGSDPTGTRLLVPGNQTWTDTGLTVRRGERVAFYASGRVSFIGGGNQYGPDGKAETRSEAYPVQEMGVAGLIGRVGNSAPFPIGSNTEPIVMPAAGRLWLGINDDNFSDNSGGFRVVISRGQ